MFDYILKMSRLEEIGENLGCLEMELSFTEMRTIKFIKAFHLIVSQYFLNV